MQEFTIDGVKVTVRGKGRELTAPTSMSGIQLEQWKARNSIELEEKTQEAIELEKNPPNEL